MSHHAEARQKHRRYYGRGRPSSVGAEDNDGDERRRHSEMRRPGVAESGAGEDCADEIGIDSSAPIVGHRGGLKRQPRDRADERDKAGDERQAAYDRRQRERQPFRRVKPKICARSECQHRRHEMGEAAEGERGHAWARSARRDASAACERLKRSRSAANAFRARGRMRVPSHLHAPMRRLAEGASCFTSACCALVNNSGEATKRWRTWPCALPASNLRPRSNTVSQRNNLMVSPEP